MWHYYIMWRYNSSLETFAVCDSGESIGRNDILYSLLFSVESYETKNHVVVNF